MKEATPLNLFEKISFRLYVFGNIAKNPFEYRIHEQDARIYMHSYFRAIEEGIPSSRPLIDERWKTYKEFETEAEGGQNIPTNQPFVIAMNHYKRGRLRGNWTGSVVFEAISKIIDQDEKRRYRMLIADKKLHRIFRHIMFNTATVNDGINTDSIKDIFSALKDNQIIGIYPTGKDELGLHKLNPMAGKLFKMVGKRDYPVLPVGTWFDKKALVYRVNFGTPEVFGAASNFFSDQTIADSVGIKIALLLPENLRGYYKSIFL